VSRPQLPDSIVDEDILSFAPLGRLVCRYRYWLIVCFFGFGFAGLGLLALLFMVLPCKTTASLGIEMKFPSALQKKYPNGSPFSPNDILSTGLLKKAYQANHLEGKIDFSDFKKSLRINPSGDSLAALQLEYKVKLSDRKKLPIEREQLEEAYKKRREAITASEYSLFWMESASPAETIAASIKGKVLEDLPRFWAEEAVYAKKVLAFTCLLPGRLQSENSTSKIISNTIDIAERSRILAEDLNQLSLIPGGAQLCLASGTNLIDLKNRLQVLRESGLNRVQEALVNFSSVQSDKIKTEEILLGRLRARERFLFQEKAKLTPMEDAYRDYLASQRGLDNGTPIKAQSGEGNTGGATFQISESFLEKWIEMTKSYTDEEYRQSLIEDILAERKRVLECEFSVDEIKSYINSLQEADKKREVGITKGAARMVVLPSGLNTLQVMQETATELNSIIAAAEQIRNLAWKTLIQPQTELYSITTPFEINSRGSFLSLRTAGMLLAGFIFLGMAGTLLACWVFDSSRSSAQKDQENLRSSPPSQTS